MRRYAEKTSVDSHTSRAEIERTLARYGATCFMYGSDAQRAMIQFEADGRRIRFVLPMPDPKAFVRTPVRNHVRSPEDQRTAWEQATRQSWRALALAIKAKLEVVQAGIATFEEEFLAHIILPSGGTVGELIAPQLEESYRSGRMPPLLTGGDS